MFKKLGIAAIGTVIAGAATAQSMPVGFYMEGNAEYSNLSDGGDNESISAVDLTFGYSGSEAGSMPIGIELYAFYFDFGGSGPDPSLSGVLYYDTSYGRFSIGMPRPAMDDYVEAPVIGRSIYWNYFTEIGLLGSSYIGLISKASESNIYGVRFDGSYGDIKYGLSYHVPEEEDDIYIITSGMQYQINTNVSASLGFESFGGESGSTVETGFYGLIEADYGQYGGKLLVSSPVGFDEVAVEVETSYRPMDDLEIYAGYVTITDSGNFNMAYIGAEYTFLDYGYVGVSYTDTSDFGFSDEGLTNAYIGYDFMFGQR